MGKGRGPCKNVDSMVYVWIIILAAITVIFMLAGVLNVAGEISESEQGGGPWYMWYIICMSIIVIFVIIYMISMQYAEAALQTKYTKRDEEIDMGATRKLNR